VYTDAMPTGLTKDAGWQIGVSRTLPSPAERVWELLTGPRGLALWLGTLDALPTESGQEYRTAEGTTGELRSRHELDRVRLTWRPSGGEESTVQVAIARMGEERTLLRFHQERLRDAAERERRRAHWQGALDAVEKALAGGVR
jgi:uncharacterized protein YndB with AHSA1/START domain